MWHRRLGHVNSSLLNKLVSKDLVHDLPKMNFSNIKVCVVCAKWNQPRSSFKSKIEVSTTKPVELIHVDLYGPVKVQSSGRKKYILVVVNDYSR